MQAGAGKGRVWTPGRQSAQEACLGSLLGINAAQNFFPRIAATHEPTSLLLVKQLVPEPDPIFTPGERAKGQAAPRAA